MITNCIVNYQLSSTEILSGNIPNPCFTTSYGRHSQDEEFYVYFQKHSSSVVSYYKIAIMENGNEIATFRFALSEASLSYSRYYYKFKLNSRTQGKQYTAIIRSYSSNNAVLEEQVTENRLEVNTIETPNFNYTNPELITKQDVRELTEFGIQFDTSRHSLVLSGSASNYAYADYKNRIEYRISYTSKLNGRKYILLENAYLSQNSALPVERFTRLHDVELDPLTPPTYTGDTIIPLDNQRSTEYGPLFYLGYLRKLALEEETLTGNLDLEVISYDLVYGIELVQGETYITENYKKTNYTIPFNLEGSEIVLKNLDIDISDSSAYIELESGSEGVHTGFLLPYKNRNIRIRWNSRHDNSEEVTYSLYYKTGASTQKNYLVQNIKETNYNWIPGRLSAPITDMRLYVEASNEAHTVTLACDNRYRLESYNGMQITGIEISRQKTYADVSFIISTLSSIPNEYIKCTIRGTSDSGHVINNTTYSGYLSTVRLGNLEESRDYYLTLNYTDITGITPEQTEVIKIRKSGALLAMTKYGVGIGGAVANVDYVARVDGNMEVMGDIKCNSINMESRLLTLEDRLNNLDGIGIYYMDNMDNIKQMSNLPTIVSNKGLAFSLQTEKHLYRIQTLTTQVYEENGQLYVSIYKRFEYFKSYKLWTDWKEVTKINLGSMN